MTKRYAAKVDRNQSEIVDALRKVGATVQPLHTVGKGCPDLLVGFRGRNILLEVKDWKAAKSDRVLTPQQVDWHGGWKGQVAQIETVDAALAVLLGIELRGQVERMREGIVEVLKNSEFEQFNCPRCSHAEPMADCDYVFMLRAALGE